jgi:Icc-related predicted phosphoesterase
LILIDFAHLIESVFFQEWKKIPKDVDVLITHTPPHQIMDETQYAGKRKKHIGARHCAGQMCCFRVYSFAGCLLFQVVQD